MIKHVLLGSCIGYGHDHWYFPKAPISGKNPSILGLPSGAQHAERMFSSNAIFSSHASDASHATKDYVLMICSTQEIPMLQECHLNAPSGAGEAPAPFSITSKRPRVVCLLDSTCEVHQALQGHLEAVQEARNHMNKALGYLEATPGQGGYSQAGWGPKIVWNRCTWKRLPLLLLVFQSVFLGICASRHIRSVLDMLKRVLQLHDVKTFHFSQHQHVTLSKACLEDFSRHVSRFPDVVRFSVDDADLDPEALPLGFTGPLQPLKRHPVIRSKQDDFSSDEVG